MRVVALTGGIGSGKSAAAKVFAELGLPIVDLDVIAHEVTSAGAPAVAIIAQTFGSAYVTETGALDRAKMRELVFSNHTAREKLNTILHPIIYQQAVKQLSHPSDAPYRVLVIPLLAETPHYRPHIDHVVLIDCDEATQVQRIIGRNHVTEVQAKQMLAAQATREQRMAIANTIMLNEGNLQDLHEKIMDFHKNYINTCIVRK